MGCCPGSSNNVIGCGNTSHYALQVLAQQPKQPSQKNSQSLSKPVLLSQASLLPPVTPTPGSATMHLQILTAQAMADNSSFPFQRRAGLFSTLGGASPTKLVLAGGGEPQRATEVVVLHPYECSECSLLFQTPEDFLQHQGVHFQAQDKESCEPCVLDELRPRDEAAEAAESLRMQRPAESKQAAATAAASTKLQTCELCQRTFTSVNRMAAHRRVHEQGTFECDECGRTFKKAASLQTHMRTHSGVARYLCVDCGSGFTTEMTLIMHR